MKRVAIHELRDTYFTIKLVGVHHASRESIKAVKNAIQTFKPGAVAVELDRERAKMLLPPSARGESIGV